MSLHRHNGGKPLVSGERPPFDWYRAKLIKDMVPLRYHTPWRNRARAVWNWYKMDLDQCGFGTGYRS